MSDPHPIYFATALNGNRGRVLKNKPSKGDDFVTEIARCGSLKKAEELANALNALATIKPTLAALAMP